MKVIVWVSAWATRVESDRPNRSAAMHNVIARRASCIRRTSQSSKLFIRHEIDWYQPKSLCVILVAELKAVCNLICWILKRAKSHRSNSRLFCIHKGWPPLHESLEPMLAAKARSQEQIRCKGVSRRFALIRSFFRLKIVGNLINLPVNTELRLLLLTFTTTT